MAGEISLQISSLRKKKKPKYSLNCGFVLKNKVCPCTVYMYTYVFSWVSAPKLLGCQPRWQQECVRGKCFEVSPHVQVNVLEGTRLGLRGPTWTVCGWSHIHGVYFSKLFRF